MGEENEESLDLSGIKDIGKRLKKAAPLLLPLLLLLIPLAITIHVRLQPQDLVPLDRQAESSIMNYVKMQATAQVDKEYPNIPAERKTDLINKKTQEIISQNEAAIHQQIDLGAASLKSRLQYESGSHTYAYLGDIDSYYWLRMARNIVETGNQCDQVINDRCYDTYTLAPTLKPKAYDYYPIIIVWNYKFLHLFNPDMTLMQASFLTPLILSLLFTIPLFLLLYKISGPIAAVIGTVLVNVNVNFLARSLGSDNDIVNVFFQVLFLWIAVECFYAKDQKAKYIWAGLAGACLSFYAKFWTGWWYLADLFILSIAVGMAYIILQQLFMKKELSEIKKQIITFLLTGLIFMLAIFVLYGLIFTTPKGFIHVFLAQLQVLHFKSAANADYWPNVLPTVAEFNGMSLPDVLSNNGAILHIPVFLIASLGMLLLIFPTIRLIKKYFWQLLGLVLFDILLYRLLTTSQRGILIFSLLIPVIYGISLHLKKKEEEFHPEGIFILAMIVCLVTYFSMVGVRFLFLMAVPLAIFIAIFFDRLITILHASLLKPFKPTALVSGLFIGFLVFLILMQPVRGGISIAQNYVPNINDEWVATLENIKDHSEPDAIINSWWDYGHWFKYWANRRVSLDGSSQNNPPLHWLGKLLLTKDEDEARGILRMLDCGSNGGFEHINKRINDTPHSINIINELILKNESAAMELLTSHEFTASEITSILNTTHCDPPENYLITSQDMIGKGAVWAHFGNWDFRKAYLAANVKIVSEEELVARFADVYDVPAETTRAWIKEVSTKKDEGSLNAWISPWPGYLSGMVACKEQNNITLCPFSQEGNVVLVTVDFPAQEVTVALPDGSIKHPLAASFITQEAAIHRTFETDTLPLGATFLQLDEGVFVVFTSPELAGSMFTRLFFFDGTGIKDFQKVYDTTSVFGEKITTWKVAWS